MGLKFEFVVLGTTDTRSALFIENLNKSKSCVCYTTPETKYGISEFKFSALPRLSFNSDS